MHQHIVPMMISSDQPVLCIRNCGCRHPEKSQCLSCHRTSEKYKIKKKKGNNLEECQIPQKQQPQQDSSSQIDHQCSENQQPKQLSNNFPYSQQSKKQCQLNPRESADLLRFNQQPNVSAYSDLDYLFVIDFECTCDEYKRLNVQEIIEFPIIVVDLKLAAITHRFHSFVRPTVHRQLTNFCQKLTGIDQQTVDAAPDLQTVLKQAEEFLSQFLEKGSTKKVAILNDCASDVRNFLRKEAEYKGIVLKPVFKEFVDLRRIFPIEISAHPQNIDVMLSSVGMEFQGRKHRGLDDAINIARVALELSLRGYVYTEQLKENMQIIENIHYYEHLLVITCESRMKSCCSLSMVAYDLRLNRLHSYAVQSKVVASKDVSQEIIEYCVANGLDLFNTAICTKDSLPAALEKEGINRINQKTKKNNELEAKNVSQSKLSDAPSAHHKASLSLDIADNLSTCSSSSSSSSYSSSSSPEHSRKLFMQPTKDSQRINDNDDAEIEQSSMSISSSSTSIAESYDYPATLFTQYFSLTKISKLPGINIPIQTYQQSQQGHQHNQEAISFPMYPSNSRRNNNPQNSKKNAQQNKNNSSTSAECSQLSQLCACIGQLLQQGFIFTTDFHSAVVAPKKKNS